MSGINTNLTALNTQRNLSASQSSLTQSVQRLSSGLRVNSAKDDSAGLAIAERFGAQVKGMNVAVRNANDAVSLAQTAEGALSKVSDMLQRMRELSVQSANATNSTSDRTNLDAEYQQLGSEITRTLAGTQFNGSNILGANAGSLAFQVGAGTTSNDTITITTTRLDNNSTITAVTAGNITTASLATTAITNLDAAIDKITTERATYGAAQNRMESAISVLQVASENNAAAKSRIMDADYATETAALSRAQVLQQAGTAMLAQANQLPNQVLTLLR
jgi:flagellin